MHFYTDAYKRPCAACIFLRTELLEGIKIQLIRIKPRVDLIKQAFIPSLEFIACNVGIELVFSAQQTFYVQNYENRFLMESRDFL